MVRFMVEPNGFGKSLHCRMLSVIVGCKCYGDAVVARVVNQFPELNHWPIFSIVSQV